MKIKLSDGNSVEYFETIEDAAIAVHSWYEYLEKDDYQLPQLEWMEDYIADENEDEVTIEDLNDYIKCIENIIAESKGYRNSSVSARCQMGLNLSAEIIDDRKDHVVIEMMPKHLRENHRSAGNWGQYPHNGAERFSIHRDFAQETIDADVDGYAHVVTNADPNDYDLYPY